MIIETKIRRQLKEAQDTIKAVSCIEHEYHRLIAQERGLIGAQTVLEMIAAALKVNVLSI